MTALYVRCPDCAKALTQFEIDHERCACGVKLDLLEDNDAEMAVAGALRRRGLLERCEAVLYEVQWGAPAEDNLCPSCGGTIEHAEDCSVAALLSDLRKELGK